MARGRMLSKEISLDEKVDALSDDTARLLFTWLIAHLDVEGRMYGDARLFISIVAPRRNYSLKKVEKYLMEMESHGLILRYSVNGNTYLCAPNFEKHQTGLRKDKEAQSRIPPIPTDLLRTKDGQKTDLLPPKRSLSLREEKLKDPLPPKRGNRDMPLPDYIDKETWDAFLEMRQKKKAVNTIHALKRLIQALEKLKLAGDDPNEVLNQSIMNSWKGVFALKRQGGQNGINRQHLETDGSISGPLRTLGSIAREQREQS